MLVARVYCDKRRCAAHETTGPKGCNGVFHVPELLPIQALLTTCLALQKQEEMSWAVLKPEVFAAIMDHYTSGEPVLLDGHSSPSDTAIGEDDSEVVAMIKELLETRIKPAVMEDGGDILFVNFNEDTGVVTLKMQGACSGCPSSAVTLKSGIETMFMHYIPEVKEVVQADPDEAEAAGDAAFRNLERHLSN